MLAFGDTWKYLASINPTSYGDLAAAGMHIVEYSCQSDKDDFSRHGRVFWHAGAG